MSETLEEVKYNIDYHRRKDILDNLPLADIWEMIDGDYKENLKRDLIDYIINNNLDKDYR